MNKLTFIHIPKTAGTSIENAAKKHGILWGRHDNNLKHRGGNSRWHTPQKLSEPSFCVARNPYTKLISEFYHQHKLNDYNSDKLNKWIPSILDIVKTKPNKYDNHLIPQIDFCKYCSDVIRFEYLDDDFKLLLKTYELPDIQLQHHFGGHKQDTKRKNKSHVKLSINDISYENKKLIKSFYSEDFKLYNRLHDSGYYKNNVKDLIIN